MNPVELPIPPSANHLWRVVRRRGGKVCVRMEVKYRDWLDSAILTLRQHMDRVKVYPVQVRVTVCRGDGWNEKRDLDNCLKGILDALKKANRITDDRGEFVSGVSIGFGPDAVNACVLVSVEPAPN